MPIYDLELAQNIRDSLETPYAFTLLRIEHYLTPLRVLLETYSDDELNHAIQCINLRVEDLLSEIILGAMESLYQDELGYWWADVGPFEARFAGEIKEEDITEDKISKYVSISDLYIYLITSTELEKIEQINVCPHEILLLAALAIYSAFVPVLNDNDSFPLYIHYDSSQSSGFFDDISQVNTWFFRALMDFNRLIDESYRVQGVDHRPFIEEVSLAKKGQIASAARFDKARELAREIAQDWMESGSKPGPAAKNIRNVIAADVQRLGLAVVPSEATIYGWIANIFPEKLRTRGRPRKN